jgi:DMSO/TMAO reductase YedYZ molybdopterin-dependent catalytic subunit
MTIVICIIEMVKDVNKKKLLQTCLFLTLFGLLSIMSLSKVSADTNWNLQVNSVNGAVNYSLNQLLAMPVTTVNANLACYGAPIANGDWSGVSLSYLLEQSGLDQITFSINFVASDGYKVSLPVEEAIKSDVIIAYQLNGASLPETLRLVLPGLNGNMWISMITSITMSASTAQSSSGNEVPVPKISVLQSLPISPVQPQNTSPKNETITEPTATPTNITQSIQPTQKPMVQQESTPKSSGSTLEVVYGIGLGAVVALAVCTITLIRKRNIQKSPSLR